MTCDETIREEAPSLFPEDHLNERRYAAWFHELDAWTEYWDVYHPETRGRFYFGDDEGEPGLLTRFLPRSKHPPAFVAWTRAALLLDSPDAFAEQIRVPDVANAVLEVDDLVARLFLEHFGDAREPSIQADYLEAVLHFATDTLPPAAERDALIASNDPRKATAGRHTLDGDLMWFAWALQLEGARITRGIDQGHARRSLLLAGVAAGCAANFAWRGHRRTRTEYVRAAATLQLLRRRGMKWANEYFAARNEVYALYRIREWGQED